MQVSTSEERVTLSRKKRCQFEEAFASGPRIYIYIYICCAIDEPKPQTTHKDVLPQNG